MVKMVHQNYEGNTKREVEKAIIAWKAQAQVNLSLQSEFRDPLKHQIYY